MVYLIYLDTAATTKPKQEIIEAMMPYFIEKWHNPSSLYSEGNIIKHEIEKSRKTIADYIDANPNEIFFTSSGSESNCWAIKGFVDYWKSKEITPCIITTPIEHKSIMSCVNNLYDVDIYYIKVNNDGFVDLMSLEEALYCTPVIPTLVSIQFANNEIGTVQNIKKISNIVHKYNAVFHTDATQIFGQTYINVEELGIDMMTASGHKIGAPKGVGFLYKKRNIKINPLIYGTQMDGLRGGTENVPYIIGMAKAVELCMNNWASVADVVNIREYMICKLKEKFNCKINGSEIYRLPNNINATFPQNITGESLLYTLDLSGIELSTGSACNSKSIEPSYVLKAIGLTDSEAMRTVRFTLSDNITYQDIDFVIGEIDKAIKIIEMQEV